MLVSFAPEFEDLALNEIRRTLGSFSSTPLAPSLQAIHFAAPFRVPADTWRRRPPIYLHHLCPVHRRFDVDAAAPSLLADLRAGLRKGDLLRRFDRRRSFAVQVRILDCHPAATADGLATALERFVHDATGAPVDVRRPVRVLSVLVTARAVWVGTSDLADNVAPWPGGGPPVPPDRDRINRAECKLVEALQTFRVTLAPGQRALATTWPAIPGSTITG